MTYAYWYIKDHGVTTQAKYPYKATKMSSCKYHDEDKQCGISDCVAITPNKELSFAAAVAKNPTSAAVQANTVSFQFYKKGVYDGLCAT